MPHDDDAFQANWDQFVKLSETFDTLVDERHGDRRWRWLLPDIALIVPVDDDRVVARCQEWQQAFAEHFDYDPQPANRLHITLHYLGDLRRHIWQWRLTTWRRTTLSDFVPRIREALADIQPFEVTVGPLNAFPVVLFAEVHDDGQLRAMRTRILDVLPRRAKLLHSPGNYLPHITLGYWGKRAVAPIVELISQYRDSDPVRLRVDRVKFSTYSRTLVPLQHDVLRTAREDVIAEYRL